MNARQWRDRALDPPEVDERDEDEIDAEEASAELWARDANK